MKDVCLLITLCGLARASLGAAAAEKTHRQHGISFLPVRAGKASNSTQNGTHSVNPDEKTKKTKKSNSISCEEACRLPEKTNKSSCVVWDRHVGLYCSKHWDAPKAKANAVDAKTCMAQCLETKGCQGVSVTNSNWGERAPWCHLCQAGETAAHINLDTYWKECPTTANERNYLNVASELREIKSIEQTLCSAPGKVSSEEFAKIAGKAKLEEQYPVMYKNVYYEREDELEKLEQDKADSKHLCENPQKVGGRMNADLHCRSMRASEQQMKNIEETKSREMRMEEHALAMEINSMDSQVKKLSAEQHDKTAKLEQLQADRQKKEEGQFWKDWLAR